MGDVVQIGPGIGRRAGAPERRCSGLKPCLDGGRQILAALPAAPRSVRTLSGEPNDAYRFQRAPNPPAIGEMSVGRAYERGSEKNACLTNYDNSDLNGRFMLI